MTECLYCGKDTMGSLEFSLWRKRRIKKFCKSSHGGRFYELLKIKNIDNCRKVTEEEKIIWYKYKGEYNGQIYNN